MTLDAKWSVEDLVVWVELIGLSEYADVLRRESVDGPGFELLLKEERLSELGITNGDHEAVFKAAWKQRTSSKEELGRLSSNAPLLDLRDDFVPSRPLERVVTQSARNPDAELCCREQRTPIEEDCTLPGLSSHPDACAGGAPGAGMAQASHSDFAKPRVRKGVHALGGAGRLPVLRELGASRGLRATHSGMIRTEPDSSQAPVSSTAASRKLLGRSVSAQSLTPECAQAGQGGIVLLVELLRTGSKVAQEKAVRALKALLRTSDNRRAVLQAGGVCPLVALLGSADAKMQEHAVTAVAKLALEPGCDALLGEANAAAPLVALLGSPVADNVKKACASLSAMVRLQSNQQQIVDAGAVIPLQKLSRSECTAANEKATFILNMLARNPLHHATVTATMRAGPPVSLLRSSKDSEREQGANAILYLAKKNVDNRAAVGAAGGVALLVPMLSASPSALELAAGALWYLSRHVPNCDRLVQAGAVPSLLDALSADSAVTQERAAATLRNLASSPAHQMAVANGSGLAKVIETAGRASRGSLCKYNALAVLSNLAACAALRPRFVSEGALGLLVDLVEEGCEGGDDGAAEKAAATLWQLCRSRGCRNAVVAHGGVAPLVSLLRHGSVGAMEYAARALQPLSRDAAVRETVRSLGGVSTLLTLAHDGRPSLRAHAAAALHALSATPEIDTVIRMAGGIPQPPPVRKEAHADEPSAEPESPGSAKDRSRVSSSSVASSVSLVGMRLSHARYAPRASEHTASMLPPMPDSARTSSASACSALSAVGVAYLHSSERSGSDLSADHSADSSRRTSTASDDAHVHAHTEAEAEAELEVFGVESSASCAVVAGARLSRTRGFAAPTSRNGMDTGKGIGKRIGRSGIKKPFGRWTAPDDIHMVGYISARSQSRRTEPSSHRSVEMGEMLLPEPTKTLKRPSSLWQILGRITLRRG